MKPFGTEETITVYWGRSRRYFSLKSAARNEAWAMIMEKCDCEPSDDEVGGGWACRFHDQTGDYGRNVVDRLAKKLVKRAKKEGLKSLNPPRDIWEGLKRLRGGDIRRMPDYVNPLRFSLHRGLDNKVLIGKSPLDVVRKACLEDGV